MDEERYEAHERLVPFTYASLVWKLHYVLVDGGLANLARDLNRYSRGNGEGDRKLTDSWARFMTKVLPIRDALFGWPDHCPVDKRDKDDFDEVSSWVIELETQVHEPLKRYCMPGAVEDAKAINALALIASSVVQRASRKAGSLWDRLNERGYYQQEADYPEKFVVAFDMVEYTRQALDIHRLGQHKLVFMLNDCIREQVRVALAAANLDPNRLVTDMSGDGGLVYLDSMKDCLAFVDNLKQHAKDSGDDSYKWRIGISFGAVGFRNIYSPPQRLIMAETGGIPIIDAVRIMQSGDPDDVIVSDAAHAALPEDEKSDFISTTPVFGKPHELRVIEAWRRVDPDKPTGAGRPSTKTSVTKEKLHQSITQEITAILKDADVSGVTEETLVSVSKAVGVYASDAIADGAAASVVVSTSNSVGHKNGKSGRLKRLLFSPFIWIKAGSTSFLRRIRRKKRGEKTGTEDR